MSQNYSSDVKRQDPSRCLDDRSPLLSSCRVSSPVHKPKTTTANPGFTVDLWESVLSDVAREAELERECEDDAGVVNPDMASAAEDSRDSRPAHASAGSTLAAEVLHRKKRAVMTFDKASDKLKIVRLASKPNGKDKTVLYVPMHAVLNVETPEERDLRQRTNTANDETTKLNLNDESCAAGRFFCSFAEDDGDSHVYAHSRANTLGSSVSGGAFLNSTNSYSGLGVSSGTAFLSSNSPPDKYLIHYTKVDRAGTKKSIHTVEVSVADSTRRLMEAFTIVKALLRRIYLCGPKKLIAFISPKSGTGQGKEVFNTHVRPFLHFSRHSLRVMVTTRAHDAEDYLADLDHSLDGSYVAIAVGGDGMMHEVVNGLHRRKLQLTEIIRQECRRRTETERRQTSSALTNCNAPLSGSVTPQQVFFRGLLNEENEEGGEEFSDTASLDKKKTRQEAPAPSRSDSGTNRCADVEPTALDDAAGGERNGNLDEERDGPSNSVGVNTHTVRLTANGKCGQTTRNVKVPSLHQHVPTLRAATGLRNVGSTTAFGGGGAVRSPAMESAVSPETPQYFHMHHNTLSTSSMPMSHGRRRMHETTFEGYVTNLFLRHGWDGLIPMTATVPTGSACGLAKSLDVLSTTQAAIALVHLSWCPEDLMEMRFEQNSDLIAFHRDRWSKKKLKRAEERFRQYQDKAREELSERGTQQLEDSLDGRQLPQGSGDHSSHSPGNVTEAPGALQGALLFRNTNSTIDTTGKHNANSNNITATAAPFLKDGSAVYQDPISCSIGAPEMSRRVAFMSLSFGVANDVDRGSEPLRWMGNARFTIYGGYVLLKGITSYRATIRYLPWVSKDGFRLEKLHRADKMPDPSQFPRCTMKADCPHCLDYPPQELPRRGPAWGRGQEEQDSQNAEVQDRRRRDDVRRGLREFRLTDKGVMDPAAVADASDAAMLGEDVVDFNDETLPWVTIRGGIYNLLFCSLRDIAQDMMMAPLAHMSDGAIDLVFSRVDTETGKGGRKEFLQFFGGLESGSHVNQWFTNYVKARAVEVKVDGGISMSDGEMMPLSSVRLTKLRSSARMVRSDE